MGKTRRGNKFFVYEGEKYVRLPDHAFRHPPGQGIVVYTRVKDQTLPLEQRRTLTLNHCKEK